MNINLRNIFILLSFLTFCLRLTAQDKMIDSLKTALKNAKHDTTIIKLSFGLGETIYQQDPELAIDLWNNVVKLCTKHTAPNSALGTTPKLFYLKYLADALSNIGFLSNNQGDNSKALDYYQKGLMIRVAIKDKFGIAESFSNIGYVYEKNGDIPQALEYYHKSLKIREEIKDKIGVAQSLNNIGLIYDNLGDIPNALEYYHKSLKIQEEVKDKKGLSSSLNNIGMIYTNLGDIAKALEYFHKSLKIREDINYKKGIAISLNNIGLIYIKKGDIAKALEYFHKSLKIKEEIKDKKGVAKSLINIADALLQKGTVAEAHVYAQHSLITAKELGYPDDIKNAALTLKNIFKKQNKFKDALEMHELEILMRDSTINEQTKRAGIKKQFQYQYEKKAAADSIKNAEEQKVKNAQLTAQQAQIKQEKTQRYALYGGLALVIAFSGFVFNRFKITQKQKIIIELKEQETQQQKDLIEEKHKEITDSINYAERIQRSFLATSNLLDENLKDYFVLFQPKDVVSGDFYWAGKLNNGNFVLATADSTGHGVPGAIMSLLNVTSLESAIKDGFVNPSDILNSTRKTIIERLRNDGSEHGGKDGMDCSLISFDFVNSKITYAAANNPVWIVRENQILELTPDKMPVGKHDKDTIAFTQHTIDLQQGDMIYTFTDGFPDQFGGPNGKKFMSKKLKETLISISDKKPSEQKNHLKVTLNEWMEGLEQVDDITIIGIRI